MLNYDHIMENRQDLIHVPYRPMFCFVLFCVCTVLNEIFNSNSTTTKTKTTKEKREKQKTNE